MTREEIMVSHYQTLANLLQDAIAEAQAASRILTWLKNSRTNRATLRRQVVEINDAERWLKLDDGTKVGLLEKSYPDIVAPGSWVDLGLLNFADGTAAAETMAAVPTGPAVTADLLKLRCLELRIAPAPNLLPGAKEFFLLHHPEAYTHGGVLYLEQGTRLAVVSGGCLWQTWAGKFIKYRVKLDLSYYRMSGSYRQITLATSLAAGQLPVGLPGDMHPAVKATLTVTILRRECPVPMPGELGCSAPEQVSVDSYKLSVQPQFSYARAKYRDTVFDLEDSPKEKHHRTTQVTNLVVSPVLTEVPEVFLEAMGYATVGSQSTDPHLHFEVGSCLGANSTVPSLFEAFDYYYDETFKSFIPKSTKLECYAPDKNQILFSTNKKWSN